MIKAIIFDVGGVLLRTFDQGPRLRWEERLGLKPGDAEMLVFNSPHGRMAQRGEVTEEAHWQWVGRELKLPAAELAEFRRDFWAGDRLDTELVQTIRQMRSRYQTGIISNALDGLRHVLHTRYPIADAFDDIVVSAEEGIMKPDAGIFALALARLSRAPQEAVFIDDMPANVAGARAAGLFAIHFTPGTDLLAELLTLGIHVNNDRGEMHHD